MQDICSKVKTRTWALAIEQHDSHDFSHLFHPCLDLLRDVVLLYCPLCLANSTAPFLVPFLPSKGPCSGSWLEYLTKCVTFMCPSLMFSTLTMYLRAGSSSLIFLHLKYIDHTWDFVAYQCLNVSSMSLTVWKQFEGFLGFLQYKWYQVMLWMQIKTNKWNKAHPTFTSYTADMALMILYSILFLSICLKMTASSLIIWATQDQYFSNSGQPQSLCRKVRINT